MTIQNRILEATRNLQRLLEIVDPGAEWARRTVADDLSAIVLLSLILSQETPTPFEVGVWRGSGG